MGDVYQGLYNYSADGATAYNAKTGKYEKVYINPNATQNGYWGGEYGNEWITSAGSQAVGAEGGPDAPVFESDVLADPAKYAGWTLYTVTPSPQDLGAGEGGLTGALESVFTNPLSYLGIAGAMVAPTIGADWGLTGGTGGTDAAWGYGPEQGATGASESFGLTGNEGGVGGLGYGDITYPTTGLGGGVGTGAGATGSDGYASPPTAAPSTTTPAVGGATAAAGTALSRILDGTATSADWLSVLGGVGAAGLDLYGNSQAADAYKDIANQYIAFGAPSRSRYEAAMQPGFDITSIPGYSGALASSSQALLSGLSTQGNPYGSPGGLIEANKQIVNGTSLPWYNSYINQNAATGFGSTLNTAAGAQTGQIGADQGMYAALGSGLGTLTQPQTDNSWWANLLKQYGGGGLNTGSGSSPY